MLKSIQDVAGRIAASALLVAMVTWIGFGVLHVNSTTAAMLYLLAVLAVASHWGLPASSATAVLAMLAFNYYFLPPIGTFTIADPQNWVALVAFLITGFIASHLSNRAAKKTEEAIQRRQEMEKLYDLSRAMLLDPGEHSLGSQIARAVARIFGCDGVAFFDRAEGIVHRAGPTDLSISEAKLKDVAMQSTGYEDSALRLTVLPVSLGGHGVGSIALAGGKVSEAALHAMANLAAIAMEKQQAQAAANRSDALRHSEELKSTLLDAVAHEFKTPLTSIKAAATALLSRDGERDDSGRELLTIVNEECDRLSDMVTEAIQMARIEAGRLKIDRKPMSFSDVVEETMQQSRAQLEDRTVCIDIPAELPAVLADVELVHLVLRQLLNNALKYSPPGSPLEIHASAGDEGVTVTLTDHGSGIPEYDQARIFEKFYRGRDVRGRVPGTGMGLAIAREIVEAQGGRIWVNSRPGKGAEFSFVLPMARTAVTQA